MATKTIRPIAPLLKMEGKSHFSDVAFGTAKGVLFIEVSSWSLDFNPRNQDTSIITNDIIMF